MKVLVDTCVWSLALRRKNRTALSAEESQLVAQLTEAIEDGDIVMIGSIRQEVLSGIKEEAQFTKIEKLLAPFSDEELLMEDYVSAARLFSLCRKHGVECGPVDMLICAVAVRLPCLILTCDYGLIQCMEVLRTKKLFPTARR
jgi:hypothetical protein